MFKEIQLSKLITKFSLKTLFIPKEMEVETYKFYTQNITIGIYEFLGRKAISNNQTILINNDFVNYYNEQTPEEKKKGLKNWTNQGIRLIIFATGENIDKDLLAELVFFDLPILHSKLPFSEISSIMEPYILSHNKEPYRMHGSMISIYGEGVIIMGASGIGKSEATLDLIKRNHLFVADDAIDVTRYADKLIGLAPKSVRGFLEVRGLGIVNIKKTYGFSSFRKQEYISLILELKILENVKTSIDRLGNKINVKNIQGIDVPVIEIPISSGRNVVDIIESAVMVFIQKKYDNYTAINELNENLKKY